jgi:hypothetical protein
MKYIEAKGAGVSCDAVAARAESSAITSSHRWHVERFHNASTSHLGSRSAAVLKASTPLYERLRGSGASRARTGDLLLAKQALFQLSYGPAGPTLGRLQLTIRIVSG